MRRKSALKARAMRKKDSRLAPQGIGLAHVTGDQTSFCLNTNLMQLLSDERIEFGGAAARNNRITKL